MEYLALPACSAKISVEGRNGRDGSPTEPCRRLCLAMAARVHWARTPIWWPVTLRLRRVVLPHRTQRGQLPRISGRSKLAETISYATSRRAVLERFPSDGRIEIDSDIVERAIRPQTITRKNALSASNHGGVRTWRPSLPAKMNDVDPFALLSQTLERSPTDGPSPRSKTSFRGITRPERSRRARLQWIYPAQDSGAWGRKCRTHPPSVVLGVTFCAERMSELRGCVLETTMLPATEI